MPSQFDYLADDALREGLRRREPAAECRLAQRYNRGRRPQGRLAVPSAGQDYQHYDRRLLALLWALADNAAALRVLAQQHGCTRLESPPYEGMPQELLAFLWSWGRDALALETLWTRRGRLPLERVEDTTPDAVLGFLWWRQRRVDARDELFRRYHLGGADDAAQDRALTLLLVVDRWDYEHYASFDHLMNVSAAHRRIDAGRHGALAPRSDQQEAENAVSPRERVETPIEERDYLETNVPLELRCLHKIRENSDEHPLDLTAEELDYLARKNLLEAGCVEHAGPPWARERTRILEWMAHHPQPGEAEIRSCFPWFRQSGLSRQTRLWRLHWRADENNRLLTALLTGADKTLFRLGGLIQESMDELVRRIAATGREKQDDERGPVLLMAAFMESVEDLRNALERRRLSNGRLTLLGAWRTNAQTFLDAFPILVKLTSCRRLAYGLLHAGFPPREAAMLHRLSAWLDGGQWLATFGREDRGKSEFFSRHLLALSADLPDEARAALDLLMLWLQATRKPGEAERRLLDLDRAWHLSRAAAGEWPVELRSLANDLISAANRTDWTQTALHAGQMFRRLNECPQAAERPVRELQDCLLRLVKGR